MGITERKKREKEKRKSMIIDAAEKVFFKKGYENATMDEVAKEAELSKGTLYLYFKSKEILHFEINLKGLNILSNMLKNCTERKKTGAENALEMGKTYIYFSQQYSDYYNAFMHFVSSKLENIENSLKKKILEPGSALVQFIDIIDKGKCDGTIRTDLPSRQMAVILWSQLTGILQFVYNRKNLMNIMELNAEELVISQFKVLEGGIIRNIKLF